MIRPSLCLLVIYSTFLLQIIGLQSQQQGARDVLKQHDTTSRSKTDGQPKHQAHHHDSHINTAGNTFTFPSKIIIPNLPREHYQFWLKNHPLAHREFEDICSKFSPPIENLDNVGFQTLVANLTFESAIDDSRYYERDIVGNICSRIGVVHKSCWGYENNCQEIYLMPECYGTDFGQAKSEQDQKIIWFGQADFGYILNRRKELAKFCAPDLQFNHSIRSSFECTRFFKMCRGENLIMRVRDTFSDTNLAEPSDQPSFIDFLGGWNCDLQPKRIVLEDGQRGFLQSWYDELQIYSNKIDETCDQTIEKQTFLIKLDSPVNMYHYFCSFLNLYATFHLNNRFYEDNQIIVWDDHIPKSNFDEVWRAFSKNPLKSLSDFKGKRICFKKFIFSLPPRMVEGLYYNTPLIEGCSKSGLFNAFNKHIIHKLGISQVKSDILESANRDIRVTIVSRSTPDRKIVNEEELQKKMNDSIPDFKIKLVDYAKLTFKEQLQITHNTDMLIGLHGSGLTHILFLPDWATVVELYNCKDVAYRQLARLRGVDYITDETGNLTTKFQAGSHPGVKKSADDDKFSNYLVDVDRLIGLLDNSITKIRKKRLKHFKDQVEDASNHRNDDTGGKFERGSPEGSSSFDKSTPQDSHEEL